MLLLLDYLVELLLALELVLLIFVVRPLLQLLLFLCDTLWLGCAIVGNLTGIWSRRVAACSFDSSGALVYKHLVEHSLVRDFVHIVLLSIQL